MTIKSDIKSYFEQGDTPTEQQFIELINEIINATGWADYTDDEYTSGSPFAVSSDTDTILPNNAATVRDFEMPEDINAMYSPASLAYDGGSEAFVVGETVTGGTSGASAVIQEISGDATSGVLFLGAITGTFTDNEAITGSGSGAALANGTNGPGLITGRERDALGVTIDFKLTPSVGATYVEVWLDIGGAIPPLYKRIVSFPKGSGVERPINFSTLAYTLDTWEANGAKVYVRSDGDVDIYDIRYVLHRLHKQRSLT